MRFKDRDWNLGTDDPPTLGYATLAVMMDIRDELKSLNNLLQCPNFIGIPRALKAIRANTAKPRVKK